MSKRSQPNLCPVVIGNWLLFCLWTLFFSDSTDVNSAVVRIDLKSQRATVVDEFLTHGVSSLDVFQTSRGYQVAVGNSYDTSRGSSQTSLDVYKFDVVSEKVRN